MIGRCWLVLALIAGCSEPKAQAPTGLLAKSLPCEQALEKTYKYKSGGWSKQTTLYADLALPKDYTLGGDLRIMKCGRQEINMGGGDLVEYDATQCVEADYLLDQDKVRIFCGSLTEFSKWPTIGVRYQTVRVISD